MSTYVGVLLGAGPRLSRESYSRLSELMQAVLTLSAKLDISDSDEGILSAAETLTRALEDAECTNTGRGSELNIAGTAECDALMVLQSEYRVQAAVGALPHIANPVCLCHHLVSMQLTMHDTPTSVPLFVAGPGAYARAREIGLPHVELETPRARNAWRRWTEYLQTSYEARRLAHVDEVDDRYADTVGLILIRGSRFCVCSSSGGPLLKCQGRIGPAAIVGAGGDASENGAAVCSGFGEDICALRLANAALTHDRLNDAFLASEKQLLQRKEMGVLRACVRDGRVMVEWQHTTPSLVAGFAKITSGEIEKQKLILSRHPGGGGFSL